MRSIAFGVMAELGRRLGVIDPNELEPAEDQPRAHSYAACWSSGMTPAMLASMLPGASQEVDRCPGPSAGRRGCA
jgi:hypothetical protein